MSDAKLSSQPPPQTRAQNDANAADAFAPTPAKQQKPKGFGKKRDAQQGPKKPRRVTRDYLMNYATWYLERFTASRARLEKLMRGKIRLSIAEYGTDPQEAEDWMKSVLNACEKAGFINDEAYALGRARSMMRKGKAIRVIGADLNARGISSQLVDDTIVSLRSEADDAARNDMRGTDPNRAAAAAYARRRRLGPFRRPDLRDEKRDKDLAALARQGFSYDIALRIIDADPDELEDLLQIIDGL
ncbi:regulatory protein RecX [Thalassospira marina]|uniref:Regulatory protein RecX n=1 Tax=Thalassospira marina TaxID=2048283 RepID=A0ABM6Q5I0_9PROT|nr:RecX family transcriptional regulator [Thalassospira marina]AUG51309.1 RecX family transcriptional regulator [Thalassospira marina]